MGVRNVDRMSDNRNSCCEGQFCEMYSKEDIFEERLVNELIMCHRVCSVPGYRDHYLSSTFACAPDWTLPALLEARDIVRNHAEELFGMEFELASETTATASWFTGAELPAHRDDSADYLKQREISAVVWLNSAPNFTGGDFFYETSHEEKCNNKNNAGDSKMRKIVVLPKRNKGVFFRSDISHGVERISGGERLGLLFWFTTSVSDSEDTKILSRGFSPFASLTAEERLFGLGPQRHFPDKAMSEFHSFFIKRKRLKDYEERCREELERFGILFPVPIWRRFLVLAAYQIYNGTSPSECRLEHGIADSFFSYYSQRTQEVLANRRHWFSKGMMSPTHSMLKIPLRMLSNDKVDIEDEPSTPHGKLTKIQSAPPGFSYGRFLDLAQQQKFLAEARHELLDGSNQAMRFGYSDFPTWAKRLSKLVLESDLLPPSVQRHGQDFNQLIINQYEPNGDGICPHIDLLRFQDGICGVSFGAECTLTLRQLASDKTIVQGEECKWQDSDFSGVTYSVQLQPGDLYCLSGDSRYRWTHEIAGSSVLGDRVNVTFRRLVPEATP